MRFIKNQKPNRKSIPASMKSMEEHKENSPEESADRTEKQKSSARA